MYEITKRHRLVESSSSLCSNVDVFVEGDQKENANESTPQQRVSYLSIHKSNVNILHCYGNGSNVPTQVSTDKGANPNHTMVTGAKWCNLKNQDVLVLTNVKGLQIFDGEGQLLLFWFTLEQKNVEENLNKTKFCRGIACVNKEYICVGCYNGEVLVIKPIKNSFEVVETIQDHGAPISALDGSIISENKKIDFVSSSDSGSICCYKLAKSCKQVSRSDFTGDTCTSLKLLDDGLLVVGYISGMIKVFDGMKLNILAEISAHVRVVSAMDMCRLGNTSLVISGSEDSFLRVWEISRENEIQVSQKWYTIVKDTQICGAKFKDSNSFVVTGIRNKI